MTDREKLDMAISALQQIEWCSTAVLDDGDEAAMCPLCDQVPANGHSPDCLIGILLEGENDAE